MNKLRRGIAGQLEHGPRGLVIVTDAGNRWVIEDQGIEPDLIGSKVVAEGRLSVWTG